MISSAEHGGSAIRHGVPGRTTRARMRLLSMGRGSVVRVREKDCAAARQSHFACST